MTADLIKQIKEMKKAMVNVEMTGEEWQDREAMLEKLEDVSTYLKDAMARGIEF